MSKLTLDAVLSQTLSNVARPVQLCDPTGRVLGKFYPAIDLSDWVPADANAPEVSDEELDRRVANEPRFSTADVLAYLEKL